MNERVSLQDLMHFMDRLDEIFEFIDIIYESKMFELILQHLS